MPCKDNGAIGVGAHHWQNASNVKSLSTLTMKRRVSFERTRLTVFQIADSKKSPLALLAQTCNSIGKDPTPPKTTHSSEKKDGRRECSSDGSRANSTGSSSKAEEKATKGTVSPTSSARSSFRTPPPKDGGSRDKPQRCPEDKGESGRDGERPSNSRIPATSTQSPSPPAVTTSSGGLHSNSKISLSCGNVMLEVNHREASASGLASKARSSQTSSVSTSDSLTTPVSSLPPGLGAFGLPLLGHPLSLDPASSLYHAGLSAHGGLGAAHKGGLPGAGHSPYVSYTTVRTSTGATTLVPVCKDPYCAHCQMTVRSTQAGGAGATGSTPSCPAGCTQCTHDKCTAGISSGLAQTSSLPGLSLLPPGLPAHWPLYASMYSVLPGQNGLPYVCNWVVGGSEHCGKRYATSEELLQHLRSHTSSAELSSLAAGLAPYSSSLPLTSPALACHPLYSSPATASLNPGALRQAYPRSLSPNSLLTASRYHPYKSALSSLPSPVAGLSIPPAALGPYYSPYSLYGQRIGAAVGP